jgi:hypothetical protein
MNDIKELQGKTINRIHLYQNGRMVLDLGNEVVVIIFCQVDDWIPEGYYFEESNFYDLYYVGKLSAEEFREKIQEERKQEAIRSLNHIKHNFPELLS